MRCSNELCHNLLWSGKYCSRSCRSQQVARERWRKPEQREAQSKLASDLMVRLHKDPEFIEKHREGARRGGTTQSTRLWNDPEWRAKQPALSSERFKKLHRERPELYETSGYGKKSWHETEKSTGPVFCGSTWEARACEILDADPSVLRYWSQCVHVPYWDNLYRVDFIVQKDSGIVLVEVKPEFETDTEVNLAKFTSARQYCAERNWTFEVWTEEVLFSSIPCCKEYGT